MSAKLSGRKVRKVRRVVRRRGFQRVKGRGKGSHEAYHNPETGRWTTISHRDGTVPPGTLKEIAKDLELTTEEFLELL